MSAEAGASGECPRSSPESSGNSAGPKSVPLCSLVEDGLYLGGRDAAEDEELIRGFGITHILTVDTYRVKFEENVVCLYFYAEDRAEEDLLSRFQEACQFIEKGQRSGACLVHCRFGVSRSATLVAAHLMRKYALDHAEALLRLKERRSCIGPNTGFVAQLRLFQKMGYTLNKADLQFRLFILERLSLLAKRAGSFYAVPCEAKSFWTDEDKSRGECLRCKKCRATLFFASKIVPHTPGYSIAWWDTRWQEPDGSSLCRTSIFVEPTAWLFEQARALQGRLICPHCHHKLGNYNWSGLYCECGACAQPGFHITPSRVDRAASERAKSSRRLKKQPSRGECGRPCVKIEEEDEKKEEQGAAREVECLIDGQAEDTPNGGGCTEPAPTCGHLEELPRGGPDCADDEPEERQPEERTESGLGCANAQPEEVPKSEPACAGDQPGKEKREDDSTDGELGSGLHLSGMETLNDCRQCPRRC